METIVEHIAREVTRGMLYSDMEPVGEGRSEDERRTLAWSSSCTSLRNWPEVNWILHRILRQGTISSQRLSFWSEQVRGKSKG